MEPSTLVVVSATSRRRRVYDDLFEEEFFMMNNTSAMTPAKIRSRFPKNVRFAKVPAAAMAAVNYALNKSAASLILYYMSEADGFAPSAHEIYLYTGLEKPHMIRARKELIERGFIDFDKQANTITILWDNILEIGRVALMLAENPECNVKETLKGGTFTFEQAKPKKLGQLMKEWQDDDVKPEVVTVSSEQYINAGGDRVEDLTEDEYLNWLATGNPFVQRDEDPILSICEPYRRSNDTVIEYLETTPNDIPPYEKHGEFFIEGLTEEEYWAWEKAGVPFME